MTEYQHTLIVAEVERYVTRVRGYAPSLSTGPGSALGAPSPAPERTEQRQLSLGPLP